MLVKILIVHLLVMLLFAFILSLIGLFCLFIYSIVLKFKEPILTDQLEENVEGYIVSKIYIPEYTTERLPNSDCYMAVYEDFIYVASQYVVEVVINNEKTTINNERFFKSCRVGDEVFLTLEKKIFEQKSFFNIKKFQKIELKNFRIKNKH